jgi:predicted nucleic acid-binding protein
VPKYVLDTNCYIDASNKAEAWASLARFLSWATPQLYVSSVVSAELRAGARTARDRGRLESLVLEPFVRRGRVLTPTARAWDALGLTLAALRETEGLALAQVRRSFAFDVLLAFTCREAGATLVTRNTGDMARIRAAFTFGYIAPYPERP